MDLQRPWSWTLSSQGIHRDEPIKLLHPVVIIISSSTNIVWEEKRGWPMAMRGPPGARFANSQEPAPRTSYLRDAQPNVAEPGYSVSWTSGTPMTLCEPKGTSTIWLPSTHLRASPNTKSCLSDWWTRQLHFRLPLMTAYDLTLTTLPYDPSMTYSSTRPTRRSTRIT